MRRCTWVVAAFLLGALPAVAAQPPVPGKGGEPGRRPGGMVGRPGGRMFGPGGPMPGLGMTTEVFDAARKTLELPAEVKTGVDLLDAQYADQLEAGIAELRAKMNKEYVAMILALLPEDQKPKYEAVAKALAERDEATTAAQKELKIALDKVKTSQGADKAPRNDARPRFGPPAGTTASKVDILTTHFVLTEPQNDQLDEARRENFGGLRERMQALFPAPREAGGPPDPNTFRQVGLAMRQVRDETDEAIAKVAVGFLTEPQKKDYATACAAIDACRKKTKDAEDVCRTKIVQAVGEAKASAFLGTLPGKAPEPVKGTAF